MGKLDPTRTHLREVVARKLALEAERSRLAAARDLARAAVAEAERSIRTATAALDGARQAAGHAAAAALAGGDARAAAPDFARYRAAIAAAEDAKATAEASFGHLDAKLADVDSELSYLPIDAARSEAIAPFLRQVLDRRYQADQDRLLCARILEVLDRKHLIPAAMEQEMRVAQGFVLTVRPGDPGNPVPLPDSGAFERAVEAMKSDPDVVLVL